MSGVTIAPYGPSIQEWMRQVSVAFRRAVTTSDDGHTIVLGDPGGTDTWDTVSDNQVFVAQTQPTFLTNGSLGAIYGQRLATYTGGAVDDAHAPATAAIRGYNQIATTVTYCNELAGLFVTDNYSYLGQGSGVFGQGNSYHGGRVWGLLGEGKEYPESYTATAAQTVFVVPNGFNSIGAVTKNGTVLTAGVQYTTATPNVTLASGASAGDIIKIYRGDPQYSPTGAEIGVYVAAGTDTTNAISGNRIGASIFGYRVDSSFAAPTHIGTLLNLVCDPSDASLTVDRGVLFQGRFATGIDFTASNFTASNWFIKFTSLSGVDSSGRLILAPPASATPASNGQMVFELTSNTSLKIKVKGSDGTVRSTTLTLS